MSSGLRDRPYSKPCFGWAVELLMRGDPKVGHNLYKALLYPCPKTTSYATAVNVSCVRSGGMSREGLKWPETVRPDIAWPGSVTPLSWDEGIS